MTKQANSKTLHHTSIRYIQLMFMGVHAYTATHIMTNVTKTLNCFSYARAALRVNRINIY